MRVDPGALRHELVLLLPGEVSDGQGGREPGWVEAGQLFARVEPLGQRGFAAGDGQAEAIGWRVTARFREDVRQGVRFGWGGRVLEVSAVHDPDGLGRFVVCGAQEARP